MLRYVLRRLAGLPPVLFAVSFLIFGAVRLLPGDPARIMAGPQATAEDVAGVRARLGLDRPFVVQYAGYVLAIFHGDFGVSIRSKQPVLHEVAARAPYTFALATLAYGVALTAGLAAGTIAGIRRNGWPDHFVMVGAVLGAATANFWLALMAMSLFAVQLRWLPLLGAGGWRNYVMPTLTLACAPTALVARMTRSSMIEALALDHVRTARAKGVGEMNVRLRHGLRNALLPVVTTIGLNFGGLLGGAVVTESVFNWPGLGRLLVDSVRFRDYPVIQAVTLLSVCSVVIVNLLADCALARLDPRIRFG